MAARSIMVQGTSSSAGKSLLVTALCRILHRAGVSVCPFKPQNMSLNSVATPDGGEIGRSQAVQAYACGLAPAIDMNPVLLKPATECGAQVVVQGRPWKNMEAASYHAAKSEIMPRVLESFNRLGLMYDCVVVEGAGSPAEINLREGDVANMGFALEAGCPVILVADIDRGGVFAQIVGTLELLTPAERELVKGFIINRFRGDLEILKPGILWLEQRTGKPVLGIIPYISDLYIEAEDSISEKPSAGYSDMPKKLKVIAPGLPRMSNQTDFDPLIMHPQIEFRLISGGTAIPPADLIILPGTKSVYFDFCYLTEHGWDIALKRHLRYGGKLMGICGGFQMLGRSVSDPLNVESAACSFDGLGFLDMDTTLAEEKRLTCAEGRLTLEDAPVSGYEIHMGVSSGAALDSPLIKTNGRVDGAVSADGQIIGTYWHGIFERRQACNALLKWAGLSTCLAIDHEHVRHTNIDKLADIVESSLDLKKLGEILPACGV